MEIPTFIVPSFIFEPLSNGKRSFTGRVESPDGEVWIVKELMKDFKTKKRAEKKALRLYREYDEIKSFLGPYAADTRFMAWENQSGTFSVYSMQELIEGMPFEQGLEMAQKTEDLDNFKDFLSRCLDVFDSRKLLKVIPDLSGAEKWAWKEPETNPNTVVITDQNGSLFPVLIDMGYISGEYGTQWFWHNRVLGRSVRELLESIT